MQRVTVLSPGVYIRAINDDGSDLTPVIMSSGFDLSADSTTEEIIAAWAEHNWTLQASWSSGNISVIVVGR